MNEHRDRRWTLPALLAHPWRLLAWHRARRTTVPGTWPRRTPPEGPAMTAGMNAAEYHRHTQNTLSAAGVHITTQREQDVDDLADALSALDRDGDPGWPCEERARFLIEYMESGF